VKVIIGDRIVPGLPDRALASRGFDAQQTSEPEDSERPDNLWSPAPGTDATRGRFDRDARRSSVEFWVARHKRSVAAAMAAAVAGLVAWTHFAHPATASSVAPASADSGKAALA
jgi:hypothetical protein